jgi:hypothetical protein
VASGVDPKVFPGPKKRSKKIGVFGILQLDKTEDIPGFLPRKNDRKLSISK